jgi:hypothetical protein
MTWWWFVPLCIRPIRLIGFYSASSMKQQSRVDMSPHSDTLFGLRANQSVLFLLITVCLAEKQHIPILLSFVWPDRGSNPRSTALEASTLTITRPMRLILKKIYTEKKTTVIAMFDITKFTWMVWMDVLVLISNRGTLMKSAWKKS